MTEYELICIDVLVNFVLFEIVNQFMTVYLISDLTGFWNLYTVL
jgi:hypothetical protein